MKPSKAKRHEYQTMSDRTLPKPETSNGIAWPLSVLGTSFGRRLNGVRRFVSLPKYDGIRLNIPPWTVSEFAGESPGAPTFAPLNRLSGRIVPRFQKHRKDGKHHPILLLGEGHVSQIRRAFLMVSPSKWTKENH